MGVHTSNGRNRCKRPILECTTGVTLQRKEATGEVLSSRPRPTQGCSAKEEEERLARWRQLYQHLTDSWSALLCTDSIRYSTYRRRKFLNWVFSPKYILLRPIIYGCAIRKEFAYINSLIGCNEGYKWSLSAVKINTKERNVVSLKHIKCWQTEGMSENLAKGEVIHDNWRR